MAAPLAVNSAASLWGPYKDIWQTVMNAIWKRQPEAIHRLDQVLKKHKSDFISLFRNPPKNVQQHEKIQKASTEGVAIQGQQGTRLLPEQLIREAFILSDLFDIGELAAVELLLAGEHQQPHFPGLTRGLVAVLLYWDGKRCIANSLRTLIQSRQGKTWTLELSQELMTMTTRFTDDLMEQGLTQKILTLVSHIDLNNEFDKLQRERGLGSEKHRKEVSDLIKECRQSLAESLFVWTCQSPLSKDDTLILISYLEKVTVEADGSLDAVNLSLLMALLYCFDVSFLEQGTEDREDLMHRLPLLTERQYIATIHTRLQESQPWKLPGLQATVRLAWALALRGISQLSDVTALAEFTEADEAMAELAVADNVFLFLTESVVGSENFYQEEFYIRKIHNLVTDFLALMPMKVKQLRNRADEDARMIHMSIQMGNEPPISLRRDLEHLMLLIAELYRKDPFNLELALEYWCPSEPLQTSTIMGSYLGVAHQRPPQRQVVLSKFVRQMGDLLPSTIYIPYLKMLRGLASGPQCAHYCFSLLKVNGSSHAENIQGAGGSPVSWEHFFHSLMLYHEHLRKDLPSADSVQYRHLPLRGITQKEQDGLIAFLQLTTVIVNWSENARLALCEHPQWTPVVVILGLLQCSIPPILKAELLETLTAFGRSPEIAASLWQSLEYTQVLQTVRSPGQRQAIGIEVELNEIESRCEEYPLTRAFCRLISTLVESSFPSNLGAGLRPPGFDPYLQFLRDSVFLRFRTRAYRRAAEKWEVAEVVLEVFYKLLRDYEPQLEDFVDQYVELQGEEIIAYKPPGFNLMYHLLNESPMLELSLSLLEEGVKQLDTYAPFPGKKHLEKAVQYCLALLDLTLQKENLFMDLLRESHLSLIVTPLEQLLQGINPRTKKADHVVNIARYLYHGNSNPELAFESAKILCCISCNSNIQIKLVGDFTHDQSISQKLMAGFVECLDNEDAEELINPDEELEPEKKRARIHHETRIHILNLLITSLERSPPSLALYLLGYELKKPVSTTNLQDPGVLGCPRTCLHAILNILEKGTETRNGPTAVQESPHLAELCYQVIYQLCACSDTSGPTMRYLRTSQDFLFTQLQYLPFSIKEHEISMLNQMSWLMKTAAIEMRVTSLNRQRSHTQRLLHLLLDDMPVKPYLADGEGGLEDESRSVSGFLHFDTACKVRRKILSILDSIDFSQDIPEPLQLDFFDRVQIEQVIANCEHKNARGQVVCNVKYLHRVLVAEVNALQGMAAIGQRPLLMEEINTILQYVVERNKLLQCLHAKKHALESWRQLVEIILTACPQDLIQAEDRQLIIRDLLQDVHDKILDDDAAQELMPVVAGAVFTLTAHLSQSVKTEQKQPLALPMTGQSQYVLMLDGSFTSSPGSENISTGFASIGDSSLHIILKKLLDFILKTGGGFQRVRTHLYGSLLYYLQIAQRPDEPDTLEAAQKTMWERLTAPEDVFSKLQRENMATIETYGAALMEVVCRDACDGHEIGRMLALALLDRIISVDKQQQWLLYLSNSGYLKVLVDSLADDDLTLQSLLTPQPPLLKALYTYESKMAFLTRVAKSQQGALELLRSGVIVRLAQCQVYDMRPETDHQGIYGMRDPPVFIPAPVERYRQILLPALQLCQVILTSSMAQHLQAAGQVLQFLISHSDTIQAILRCQDVSVGSLQELASLTGIISKAALPGVLSELDMDVNEGTQMELQGHIGRFQRQCLGLLSRFGGSDRLRQFKLQDDNAEGDRVNRRDEIELAMQQICANVMEYCESLMLQSAPSFQHAVCLFTPSLSESTNRDGPRQDTQAPVVPYWHLPGLGIIIYLLKQSTSDFFSYYDSHRQSVNKLQNVEQLPPDEIKELCQSVMPAGVDKISTSQKYVLARRRLVKLINNRAKLLSLCSYTIETCLFILWRHLEHYLLHCTPTDSQDPLLSSRMSFKKGRLRDSFASEPNLDFSSGLNRVSQHDIEQLQIEATNSFGESLQKKLLDIEGLYSKVRSRYTFIQALVRRIRGLLRISRT
ncbi:nuclear pore complex protein Nup205 [Falco biarmicus]|uniref:nuclear pore complex protein Nup205 n=1 Tax=Falco rusticolus TaxID=120794 RepID=UPI0018866753|nr:nuclear pore complex protein Nup205 [Falco rusticolus]XP_040450122.1 nuclear pore complex protein Nup205 [Falco naumanni]XP_055567097.1 nuclear pore complex protein Nup205 [Falco cherrug]XP_055663677.1 nuclear pore complex protein Nup205 [Falco peregrinus]XP_056196524.1 nuclear pore complex protein Nup205 [Falco biarmicus]